MKKILFVCGMLLSLSIMAQKGVKTFGIQVKPLVPNSYFNFSGEQQTSPDGSLVSTWNPRPSLNFGMTIRMGFTKALSLETGINLLRRNYEVVSVDASQNIENTMRFTFVGYEIPIQGLVYVQLGKGWWMNGSAGFSLDMYPSSTFTAGSEQRGPVFYDFTVSTVRKSWIQTAIQVNYGFEYRSKKDGYFYLGASYHRPFTDIAISEVTYDYDLESTFNQILLNGNYFTVDFRYFFHEKAQR